MRWTAMLALAVAICLMASATQGGEPLGSDAFSGEYASAWMPMEGSGPAAPATHRTPDGKPAVALQFDMASLGARAYWDRQISLDLSRYTRIAFWAKAEGDLSAVGHCSLYLHSGDGWYATSFGLPDQGWQRVVIDRSDFGVEGTPAGWGSIDTVRVAFWKGQPRQAVVWLGGLEATTSEVVVVRNTRAGREGAGYVRGMVEMLARAGLDAGTVDDVDVEAGVLEGKRIAIYPLNPSLSDKELEALEAFLGAGGKVVVCYSLSPRLAALVGAESLGRQASEYPGQFARMRALPGAPPGMPEEARQSSWNIEKVRPAGRGARVVAQWLDASGKDTGYPAIVLSDAGAYLSHVLLDDDPTNKQRLVQALLGHLDAGLWEEMARNTMAHVGPVARWASFADAEAGIREAAVSAGRLAAIEADLARARQRQAEAEACLQEGRYREAVAIAFQVRDQLLDIYARSQPARAGEFRAGWCHSGFGVTGLTWDETIRRLKENGFNAIVVNAMRAGIGDYQSKLLPVRDRVATEGDQIALAVAAGKKYGIEVHIWKVNWNLGGAPKEFVEQMRAEGRLQRARDGRETRWLCPSDPRNLALERDSMLEVVRNYDVDGIHFDYIRYDGADNCYCDGCRKRFQDRLGADVAHWPQDVTEGGALYAAYQEFRRENITRLVREVSQEAHRIKPWIKVSAAVFGNWPQCREDVGQDWGLWVQEGYLDFVCPMDYTSSNAEFRTRVQVQRDVVGGRIPLYPGVGASAPGLPLGQVIEQIQIARAEGADGFIIFEYQGGVAADFIPSLGKGVTLGGTSAPHNAPALEWQVRQDGKPLHGAAASGRPVEVEAVLTLQGRFRQPPREAWARIAVETLAGRPVQGIGCTRSDEPGAKGVVRLPEGVYRLVARGEVTLGDGTRQAFVARGPFLRVGEGA